MARQTKPPSAISSWRACNQFGQIEHWWRNNSYDNSWNSSIVIMDDNATYTEVVGLIESSWTFNLEIIVLAGNRLSAHFNREGATWYFGDWLPS